MKRMSLVLAILLAGVGCAATAPPPAAAAPSYREGAPAMPPPDSPAQEAPSGAPAQARAADAAPPATPAPQKAPQKTADTKNAKGGPSVRAPVIIYQGELKMMADEDAIAKTIDLIIDVAEALGGHIGGRKDASVQIKVPSASFREALTKIEGVGAVVSRSVTADDVSEEFHDLEVRLANLKTTRARLQEFMTRAANIADMLTVERELERVAQEIDRIEGRLEFLRSRAAMSVINVQIAAKPKVSQPVVLPTPPAQNAEIPIPWVSDVGIDPLLSLRK